jgi:dTDP-4-dehydrorhamnose reductase
MHVMITGINGLLSQNLVKEFLPGHVISGIDLQPGIYPAELGIAVTQLDLTDTNSLTRHIHSSAPDAIIHTAAYTNVDRAEIERETAFAVNARVPGVLAKLCRELAIPLIHISTDYVFDGTVGPYAEAARCDPRGVYAESKYAGEQAVLDSGGSMAVVRPNVMYGHGVQLKSSFVDWLIGELKQGKAVNIVDDQYNNPTYARRLATVIHKILDQKAWDIWHFGSKEVLSRYTFALNIADTFGLPSALINAISTVELNQAAPRPLKSGLICDKLKRELAIPILSISNELDLLKEEMNAS